MALEALKDSGIVGRLCSRGRDAVGTELSVPV